MVARFSLHAGLSRPFIQNDKAESDQGRLGFLGIQYFGVFNFRYTVFLCLKLGIKYHAFWNFGKEYISSERSISSDRKLSLGLNLEELSRLCIDCLCVRCPK